MSEKSYPSDAQDRFMVRLPDGLRDRIAEAAKANNRSMNAEIVARIHASFEQAIEKKYSNLEDQLNALRTENQSIHEKMTTISEMVVKIFDKNKKQKSD